VRCASQGRSGRVRRGTARVALAALATVAGALLLAPRVARAQSDDAATAAKLKEQGDKLMEELKYAEAYALYLRAYDLSADPALLYNEGRVLEAMGEYPDALAKIEQFARAAPPEMKARVPALDELIAELKGRIGTLEVTSNVAGARVLARGKVVGTIPTVDAPVRFALRAGTVAVEVSADGYEPYQQSLDVAGGATGHVVANLAVRHDVAMLAVRTVPEASVVLFDGAPLGPAPVETRGAVGTHTLVVRHEGYLEKSIPITLGPGERRTLDVKLDTPPTILSRWWFWAGAGAVVVTSVAITSALLIDKGGSQGSFSPGHLTAPLTVQFR
jgi:hypothetical protein